jgi:hypothetical protein
LRLFDDASDFAPAGCPQECTRAFYHHRVVTHDALELTHAARELANFVEQGKRAV